MYNGDAIAQEEKVEHDRILDDMEEKGCFSKMRDMITHIKEHSKSALWGPTLGKITGGK